MIYKKKWPAVVFLFPAFLFMIVFLYYPFFANIFQSMTKGSLGDSIRGTSTNVGFYNFQLLVAEIQNWLHGIFSFIPLSNLTQTSGGQMATSNAGYAVVNTLIAMVLTVVVQVGLALFLSILVDRVKFGQQVFRTLYFFPIVISGAALGLMFSILFSGNTDSLVSTGATTTLGPLQNLLYSIGIYPPNFIRTQDGDWYFFAMMLPVLWQYVGYYFVIITTGINNISEDVNEAAEIDGAVGFKRVRYITMPLIHNTLITCATLAITGALKIFDLPWVMFGSGKSSGGKTYLLGTLMNDFSNSDNLGYAAAIGLFMVVLGVVISMVTKNVLKERDY